FPREPCVRHSLWWAAIYPKSPARVRLAEYLGDQAIRRPAREPAVFNVAHGVSPNEKSSLEISTSCQPCTSPPGDTPYSNHYSFVLTDWRCVRRRLQRWRTGRKLERQ